MSRPPAGWLRAVTTCSAAGPAGSPAALDRIAFVAQDTPLYKNLPAADGVSVLLSSHVLAELERVADYLIVLSRGQVQMAGEVDGLLAAHRILTGPAAEVGPPKSIRQVTRG
jgi:ABC-2 type transport system ATP-binding protein